MTAPIGVKGLTNYRIAVLLRSLPQQEAGMASRGKLPSIIQQAALAALEDAYQAGRRDGAEEMRLLILHAAQAPMNVQGDLPIYSKAELPVKTGPRAVHGSVRRAIQAALSANPGLTEQDLGDAASKHDSSVSSRSIGGELRRMRDRLYRFDGRKWFLIAQPGEKETAEASEAPAVDLPQDTEGATEVEPPLAA